MQREECDLERAQDSVSHYRNVALITQEFCQTQTHFLTCQTPCLPSHLKVSVLGCWFIRVADACRDVFICCGGSSKAQFSDPRAGSELQLLSSSRDILINISISMFYKYYLFLFCFISFCACDTRTVSCKRERESKCICSK